MMTIKLIITNYQIDSWIYRLQLGTPNRQDYPLEICVC